MSEPGLGLRRQTDVYLAGVRGVRSPVPFDLREARGGCAKRRMTQRGVRVHRRRRRCSRGRSTRTGPRSTAAGSSRGCCATSPSATCRSSSSAAACRRRSCSRRSACSSSRTATRTSRSRKAAAAEGVPMIFSNQASRPMEECAAVDGRRAALVPALLEHVERARRQLRRARRGVRLRGDRRHPRHDDARLALPRPRPRLPPVRGRARGSRSTRATRSFAACSKPAKLERRASRR